MLRPHYNLNLPFKFVPWVAPDDARLEHVNPTHEVDITLDDLRLYNPELIEFLSGLDMEVSHLRLFRSRPWARYSIHIDLSPDDYTDTEYARAADQIVKINFIFNSHGTRMQWFQQAQGQRPQRNNNSGFSFYSFDPKTCARVYDTVCDRDCLIHAGRIHTAFNTANNDQDRMCYSLFLVSAQGELNWDRAVEVLTPWLD